MNLIEVLNEQRKGKCLIEAQEKLQELVKTCTDLGKKGSIIITLQVIPAETGTIVLKDDVTSKLPKPERSSTSFYVDDDGSLHREDPNQPELPAIAQMEVNQAVNQ